MLQQLVAAANKLTRCLAKHSILCHECRTRAVIYAMRACRFHSHRTRPLLARLPSKQPKGHGWLSRHCCSTLRSHHIGLQAACTLPKTRGNCAAHATPKLVCHLFELAKGLLAPSFDTTLLGTAGVAHLCQHAMLFHCCNAHHIDRKGNPEDASRGLKYNKS